MIQRMFRYILKRRNEQSARKAAEHALGFYGCNLTDKEGGNEPL
jgi:hypothetical protein